MLPQSSESPKKRLREQVDTAPVVRDFHAALLCGRPGLIAEVKKASPSAGLIREEFDPVGIARTYAAAGANCLSVLTDEKFFQGHLDFLRQIRTQVGLPVMRKEFILDRYQILEARAAGADCILLIAECLSAKELRDLHGFAGELGMQTLIELYDPENLSCVLQTGTSLVGINNRDLRTFVTSLDHTFDLMDRIPPDVLLVSESGIRTHDDIVRLSEAGVGGVLVGRVPDAPAGYSPGRAATDARRNELTDLPAGTRSVGAGEIFKRSALMSHTETAVEHVLVVPTSVFHDIGHFQGFCGDTNRYLDVLLDPVCTSYRPRPDMEQDPSYKQLIPYCIFQCDGQGVCLQSRHTAGRVATARQAVDRSRRTRLHPRPGR